MKVFILWFMTLLAVLSTTPSGATQMDLYAECKKVVRLHGLESGDSKEVTRALFRVNMAERFSDKARIEREYSRLYEVCAPMLWHYGRHN